MFYIAKFTVLQCSPDAVSLTNHFDTQSFNIVALDNGDRKSLSQRKHADNAAILVFLVKDSKTISKPTMSFTDIPAIKILEKLKYQEIVSCHFNQKLLLQNTFLTGLEVYTNPLVCTHKQPDQDALPIFCEKELFRILVAIYLQRKDEIQILIQMLCGFHAAKVAEHCTEKYVQGPGTEQSLRQKEVFSVNVVDSVLNGINFKQF